MLKESKQWKRFCDLSEKSFENKAVTLWLYIPFYSFITRCVIIFLFTILGWFCPPTSLIGKYFYWALFVWFSLNNGFITIMILSTFYFIIFICSHGAVAVCLSAEVCGGAVVMRATYLRVVLAVAGCGEVEEEGGRVVEAGGSSLGPNSPLVCSKHWSEGH